MPHQDPFEPVLFQAVGSIEDRLHRLGSYRIRNAVRLAQPQAHVPVQRVLAGMDRETLLQNIIGGVPIDSDTGVAQLNRDTWAALLRESEGCPSGSWEPKPGHRASEAGFCPTFTVGCDTAVKLHVQNIQSAIVAGVPVRDAVYVGVAAYNVGFAGALKAYRAHGDPDLHTAHGNYSRDVIDVREPPIRAWLVRRGYISA